MVKAEIPEVDVSSKGSVQGCGCDGRDDRAFASEEAAGPTCTLSDANLEERLDAFRALFAGAFETRSRDGDSVTWVLRRSDTLEQESRRLAALEATCCSPLTFEVYGDERHIIWRISGPKSAEHLLDVFYELPATHGLETVLSDPGKPTTGRAGKVIVGVGAACAACYAAPFALPWLAPLVAPLIGGVAGWRLGSAELICVGLLVGGAVLVAMLLAQRSRRPVQV